MSGSAAALWGFMGAAAIEAWDLYGAIHRVKGFPWKFEGEVALAPGAGTTAKNAFVATWDPMAPRYGQPVYSSTGF